MEIKDSPIQNVLIQGSKIPRPYPEIHKYTCYRKFLQDFYLYKKNQRAGFSFRKFAQVCGLKSPNYLQLVMKSERNLSEVMAEQIALAIKLSAYEKSYFLSLVRQENAKTDEDFLRAKKEGLAAIKKMLAKQVTSNYSQILSQWYHIPIREMIFLEDFTPSGEYVSQKLLGLITPEQGEESLRLLIQCGMLTQNENGQWISKDPVLDTGIETFTHQYMQKHHSETLHVWAKNMEKMKSSEQELGLINIPISKNKIPELKQKMRNFQDEIIGWLQAEDKPDQIVQLGTYLMPISRAVENKKKN